MIYDFTEKKKSNDLVEKKLLALKEEYQKNQMSDEQLRRLRAAMEEAKMTEKKENKKNLGRWAMTAVAFIGAFMILPNTSAEVAHAMGQIPLLGQLVQVVTFRDYQYKSDRSNAEIEVPELKIDEEIENSQLHEELAKTTDEINAEIKDITDEIIAHFETYLEEEEGYQDIIVKSEVLTTTQDYFTLKLLCYQGTASGYQWNYYYTVDLNTGERLQLKDFFAEGIDYITPISNNIKEQMQDQMDADEQVYYWLHDEMEECNFKTITDETSFYINESGNVVIGFNEGEVAPMYMGAVEFEIPAEVLGNIRK